MKKKPTASIGLSGSTEQYRKGKGKYKKGQARCFGQDLMKGEHVVGQNKVAGLLFKSDSGRDPQFYEQKRAVEARLGRTLSTAEFQNEHYVNEQGATTLSGSGTSIFDPVLCELSYRWFCPPKGLILDPFAGGSVRGVVASVLGFAYTGFDLSERQVAANRVQAAAICKDPLPCWHAGDSRDLGKVVAPASIDMVFSCPPYFDLEVYSEDPADISTLTWPAFLDAYRAIITAAATALRPERFACFVVGDVRDKGGFYRNLPGETINAFQAAGLTLYNDAVLVTAVGSLPIRIGRQFAGYRKLGTTHQRVLVFYRGEPKALRTWPAPEFSQNLLAEAPSEAMSAPDENENDNDAGPP